MVNTQYFKCLFIAPWYIGLITQVFGTCKPRSTRGGATNNPLKQIICDMRYAGWLVSYEDYLTNEVKFSGPYSVIEDAKKFAKEQRDNAKNIKIYHLVLDNQQQII